VYLGFPILTIMTNAQCIVEGCASPGCTNVVEQRLACPKCIEIGIQPSYICSQDCFKKNYGAHKKVHAAGKKRFRGEVSESIIA
jgi:zf-MYND-like zinc finger, mRNA-binding